MLLFHADAAMPVRQLPLLIFLLRLLIDAFAFTTLQRMPRSAYADDAADCHADFRYAFMLLRDAC